MEVSCNMSFFVEPFPNRNVSESGLAGHPTLGTARDARPLMM